MKELLYDALAKDEALAITEAIAALERVACAEEIIERLAHTQYALPVSSSIGTNYGTPEIYHIARAAYALICKRDGLQMLPPSPDNEGA